MPKLEIKSRNLIYLTQMGLLAAVYFGAAKIGLSLASVEGIVSLVWPPTGIALAALLLFGYRLWPGIALGAFLVNASAGASLAAVGISIGNTLEAVTGAYLLGRFVGFRNSLERLRDVLGLVILAAAVSTTIGATIGTASLALAGAISWAAYPSVWLVWWLGDAMGALLVAPVLLTWATHPRLNLPPRRVAEAVLLLAALIIVGEFVFGGFYINKDPNYPLVYIVFPFVIWAAFRFGQRGAVMATLVSTGMAVWSTIQGIGPFSHESLETSLLLLYGFMGTIAITVMILAAAMAERKQTEEALRASEERFRQVVLSISDHIYVSRLTDEGCFINLYLSPHVETLTGYPLERFMTDWGFWSATVIHPDDKAAAINQAARLVAGQNGEVEYRLVRANGEIIWVRDSVRVQPHGTSTLIYGVVSDITTRRQDEEALRQSQERYRLLFEASPISLWEEDFSGVKNYLDRLRAEGVEDLRSYLESHPEIVTECAALVKIVDLNKAALELELRQGGSKEQFLKGLNQVFGPEAYHSFREEVLMLAAGQTEFETEKFSYTLAGDKKYLRIKSSIAPGSEETWSKVLVSVVDLTERKQAEEELQKYRNHLEELVQERTAELLIANTHLQQEIAERKQVEETLAAERALLRTLIDNLPDCIYAKDTTSRFVLVNSATMRLLGITAPEESIGKTDFDFFPPELAAQYFADERALFQSGQSLLNHEEMVLDHQTGELRWLLSTKVPLRNGSEQIVGLVGMNQDITERKQAEEALRESEAKLRALFEILPVGVTILDKDRKIVDLNPSLERILAVSKEGLLRGDHRRRQYIRHDGTLMTPAELPSTRAFEEQRVVANVEIGVVKEDGVTVWTNVSAAPLLIADFGAVIVTTDITERKRAEQRFRGLLESAPDAMVIVNRIGEIILVNSQAEKLFGYTRSELLGQTVEMLLPARFRNQHFGHRAGYFDNSHARAMGADAELFGLHRDSREFPVEISLSPLQMEGEIYVISAIRDITERKRAEEALRASEERFAKAFRASPVAISITTLAEGRFLNVNDYFLDLMGYCQEEVIGHTSLELGVWPQPEFRDKVARALREQLSIRSMEIPFRTKSGEIIETLASMEPIDWAGERCIFCMTQDISKRKQAEARQTQLLQELESTNQELNDFAYIVSHDLKAPLRAIGSLADWIATDYAEQVGKEGQEQLNLLVGRVKRMHALIDGVLQYSRLGRSREEKIEVNLNNLVAEVIDLIDPSPHIALKIDNNLPVVVGRKIRLQQLFQNLLNNAIKFMDKPQGQISVSYLERADFWQFCVADNGPGIEAKHFAKIFQLFQTLSPRDEFESTGVGLALVKKIVELHGGKVWVESKVGEGSAFFFTLPK